ncbi:hypothetical protein ACFWBI_08960 [Streptomyces sp. NPDC059982]|uniref:hypothetical protein n=1 Tax=unclassified Streptomyces TaxID=2593676 RepID=UPI0036B5CB38
MSEARTVDYLLQAQQPDGSWENASAPMHQYTLALARLDLRRQNMPEHEHRIVERTTVCTVMVLPIDDKAPTHNGGNAEDCPACARHLHNIAYPFLCPGP